MRRGLLITSRVVWSPLPRWCSASTSVAKRNSVHSCMNLATWRVEIRTRDSQTLDLALLLFREEQGRELALDHSRMRSVQATAESRAAAVRASLTDDGRSTEQG